MALMALGDTKAIVEGMDKHKMRAGWQNNGCWALSMLAAINAENKVKIAEAGGIQAIVEGTEKHKEHAGVQENGCGALVNLAANNAANKASIRDHGGLGLAREAYAKHKHAMAKELIYLLT